MKINKNYYGKVVRVTEDIADLEKKSYLKRINKVNNISNKNINYR